MKKVGRPKETDFAMVAVSVAPVRALASDRAEMVTQLLFGECVEILSRKGKAWRRVKVSYDDYQGWVDPKQLTYITENQYLVYKECSVHTLELTHSIYNDEKAMPLLIGSPLHGYDGMNVRLPSGRYSYQGQTLDVHQAFDKRQMLINIAKRYLHSPYLWGGRSPFGIDCSGFTQVIYKMIGVKLPRDAKDQIDMGQVVDFIAEAKVGDLAFFENKEGRIHHVGMILDNQQIIHASGCVRIDYLDHQGIFKHKRRTYTHKLRLIKRLLD